MNPILRARKRREAVKPLAVFRDPEYLFMKRKIESAFPDKAKRDVYISELIRELPESEV